MKAKTTEKFYIVYFKKITQYNITNSGYYVSYRDKCEDKTNIEWHMELEEGDVFTIYDWKSNCVLDMDKRITWCIGAHELLIASKALAEIETRKQINEEIKKIIFPSK